MASNFLGDVVQVERISSILSGSELIAREGVNLQKGMNFRDDAVLPSVLLVLPHEGVYKDEWDKDSETYVYEGHDSTTVENGKLVDQILMYESGKLTDNGKFRKAANEFKDGIRKEPLQVHLYEKLDSGIWFDKGMFNLVDSAQEIEEGRKVYTFHLNPVGAAGGTEDDSHFEERMIPASQKAEIWLRDAGRCAECGSEEGLRFAPRLPWKSNMDVILACIKHQRGQIGKGMLG